MNKVKMQIIIETNVDADRWEIKTYSIELMQWLKMIVADKINEYQGGDPMEDESLVQVKYQAEPSRIIQPNQARAKHLGIMTGSNQAPHLRAVPLSSKPAVVKEIHPGKDGLDRQEMLDLFDGLDKELQGPIDKRSTIEKAMDKVDPWPKPLIDKDFNKSAETSIGKMPDPKLGNDLLKEAFKEESSED